MANGLLALAGLCALYWVCACNSTDASEASAAASSSAEGGEDGAAPSGAGQSGASAAAGALGRGGSAASAGSATAGGSTAIGSGGNVAGDTGGPPPTLNGKSVYAQECHGDSKDCNLAAVPCFGVGSATPNVAAGWACANRCESEADCSTAPSGAQAQASCVPFTSSGHCVLVCRTESQSFTCPGAMTCYSPPKSPIGYCLWQ
ncbi:MAG: hypothetical protein K0R38_110 [Polyangiaceae bacterium]|jgi:hypothetical protein|nr:hypothetical protein [Polyangiaceae bacterium]